MTNICIYLLTLSDNCCVLMNNSCHQLMTQIPHLSSPLALSNSRKHTKKVIGKDNLPYSNFSVELNGHSEQDVGGGALFCVTSMTFKTVCNSAAVIDNTETKLMERQSAGSALRESTWEMSQTGRLFYRALDFRLTCAKTQSQAAPRPLWTHTYFTTPESAVQFVSI